MICYTNTKIWSAGGHDGSNFCVTYHKHINYIDYSYMFILISLKTNLFGRLACNLAKKQQQQQTQDRASWKTTTSLTTWSLSKNASCFGSTTTSGGRRAIECPRTQYVLGCSLGGSIATITSGRCTYCVEKAHCGGILHPTLRAHGGTC
jgi:hypothetical protein